jgi:hypothetical protein
LRTLRHAIVLMMGMIGHRPAEKEFPPGDALQRRLQARLHVKVPANEAACSAKDMGVPWCAIRSGAADGSGGGTPIIPKEGCT